MINRTYIAKLPTGREQGAAYLDICVQAHDGHAAGARGQPGRVPGRDATARTAGRRRGLDRGLRRRCLLRDSRAHAAARSSHRRGRRRWLRAANEPRFQSHRHALRRLVQLVGSSRCSAARSSRRACSSTWAATPAARRHPGHGLGRSDLRHATAGDPSLRRCHVQQPRGRSGLLLVSLNVMERKDEDFCHIGSP